MLLSDLLNMKHMHMEGESPVNLNSAHTSSISMPPWPLATHTGPYVNENENALIGSLENTGSVIAQ